MIVAALARISFLLLIFSQSNISKTSASVLVGFQHEKKDGSTRLQAEWFYCFSFECLETQ